MPEDFDLEAQLRRYADQVERQVGDVAVPMGGPFAPRARRWPIYLAVAAALLLIVGLASTVVGDDEGGIDPVNTPDVEADDEDPVVSTTTLLPPSTTSAVPPATTLAPIEDVDPVPVPNVIGMFADTALQELRSQGFDPIIQFLTVDADSPDLGRVVDTDPPHGTLIEPGSTITLGVGEEWIPITDAQARRVVDGYLAALAAEEWAIAQSYTDNGATIASVFYDLGVEEDDFGALVPALIDHCSRALCGAAWELGELTRDGLAASLDVTFSSASGPVTVRMPLTWFEGQVAVDAVPPIGEVGTPAPSLGERLFGEPYADGLLAAWANHAEWIQLGDATNTPSWRYRLGGTLGAEQGQLVISPFGSTVLTFENEVVDLSPDAFAGTSHSLASVFTTDGETVTAHALSGGPTQVLELNWGANLGNVTVDHLSIEGQRWLVTVSFDAAPGFRESTLLVLEEETQVELPTNRIVASATLAPDGGTAVALYSPSISVPLVGVVHIDMATADSSTSWDLPERESFVGPIDFDGRWALAPLESGRLFVVDTVSDSARVVDVYAEVWFD